MVFLCKLPPKTVMDILGEPVTDKTVTQWYTYLREMEMFYILHVMSDEERRIGGVNIVHSDMWAGNDNTEEELGFQHRLVNHSDPEVVVMLLFSNML